MSDNLHDAGMKVRREVLGDAHVDRAVARTTEFSAPFQEFITNMAWGSIWTRPGLPRHARSLLTLAMMIALTLVMLIFCEVAPKTFGALHPESLATPAAYVYTLLLAVLYPFVWATNLLANGVLRLLGASRQRASNSLSSEELRTVVAEAGAMIPQRHQQMLMSILDLEKATVEDIMVPRVEIVGIDIEDSWDKILEQLRQSQHTRLPVFEGDIDRIIGVLHMKRVVHELARGRLNHDNLIEAASVRDGPPPH